MTKCKDNGKMLTLSVSVITMNRKDMLRRCLNSIYEKIEGIEYEVVIVDNNSKDGTAEIVRKEFNNVLLIVNKTNKGVAGSRNQTIECYKGRYLLLLDDDVEILSSNFDSLISYMDQHDNVGLLGCRILTPNNQIYPSARSFPHPLNILCNRLSFLPFLKNNILLRPYQQSFVDNENPRNVDFAMGAFQLIKRQALDKVGFLDEKMKYGFEDADLCARLKKAGYHSVYYPTFMLRHYKGIVSERFNKFTLYFIRSYIRLYFKHRDLIKKPFS